MAKKRKELKKAKRPIKKVKKAAKKEKTKLNTELDDVDRRFDSREQAAFQPPLTQSGKVRSVTSVTEPPGRF